MARDWDDPSRRTDRIANEVAARRAEQVLDELNGGRYSDYVVVNVSFARRGEVGPEPRWLVLCDRPGRTRLREAIVVELRATDGRFLRARRVAGSSAVLG
jgi:hypothetical protein